LYTSLAFFKFKSILKLLIMKKTRFYFLLIVFQLTCFNVFSQKDTSSTSYFSDQSSNLQENTSLLINTNALNNSLTRVKQISNAASDLNSVALTQVGLFNVSEISQSMQTSQSVIQFGNKNFYSFRDFRNSTPVNLSILQQGNANSLQIYGSNSIINGMKIVQKSNFKNIVVKNYK